MGSNLAFKGLSLVLSVMLNCIVLFVCSAGARMCVLF